MSTQVSSQAVRSSKPMREGEQVQSLPAPAFTERRNTEDEFYTTRAMLEDLISLYESAREREIARRFFRLGMKRCAQLMK